MEISRPGSDTIRFKEPGEYTIDMTIADDCKRFDISIESSTPFEAEDIVMALEQFLYDNILDGHEPEHGVQ